MCIRDSIVRGLWDGISSMVGWIKDKVDGFVDGLVGGVKGVLGINSPSLVFAGIGENMGEGIGVGFNHIMNKVSKDMKKSVPTDFDFDTNLNMSENFQGIRQETSVRSIVEHTGVIEVRGINNKNELTGVVEIIMDQFRREARI